MPDVFIQSSLHHPLARPLVEGVIAEHAARNGRPDAARSEVFRYPEELYFAPLGNFLLVQRDGQTIAGGAFMSHDDETVEIKRVWTDPSARRQGLARAVMSALEESAAALGYTRSYLTTGFRRPEAIALYLHIGYRPLFDPSADPLLYRTLPFEKHIGAKAGQAGTTPIYHPAASFEAAEERGKAIKAEQEKSILARLARHKARSKAALSEAIEEAPIAGAAQTPVWSVI